MRHNSSVGFASINELSVTACVHRKSRENMQTAPLAKVLLIDDDYHKPVVVW